MTALTQSYYCGASTTQIIYETIGGFFDRVANEHPNNPALVLRHQNVDWTYSELQQRVDQLAACLLYTSPSPRDLSTSRMPSSA